MKIVVKEGQVVIAGRVGKVDKKSDSLVSVSIADGKKGEETTWSNVAFTNPKEDGKGQKLADLADKYIVPGQEVTVIANAKQNGEYTNYYAVFVQLGHKPEKK